MTHLQRSLSTGLFLVILGTGGVGFGNKDRDGPRSAVYGAEIELRETTPLAEVVAHPERFADQKVLIRGRISDVCQRKGCWTVLADGSAHLRIRFEDYGFFVPKDSMGREAYAEGRVSVATQSEKEARHYASESKDGDASKIHGPQRTVGFMASGVRILEE